MRTQAASESIGERSLITRRANHSGIATQSPQISREKPPKSNKSASLASRDAVCSSYSHHAHRRGRCAANHRGPAVRYRFPLSRFLFETTDNQERQKGVCPHGALGALATQVTNHAGCSLPRNLARSPIPSPQRPRPKIPLHSYKSVAMLPQITGRSTNASRTPRRREAGQVFAGRYA